MLISSTDGKLTLKKYDASFALLINHSRHQSQLNAVSPLHSFHFMEGNVEFLLDQYRDMIDMDKIAQRQ